MFRLHPVDRRVERDALAKDVGLRYRRIEPAQLLRQRRARTVVDRAPQVRRLFGEGLDGPRDEGSNPPFGEGLHGPRGYGGKRAAPQ